MYRFLAKQFRLDLSRITDTAGKIDESFVIVHDRDALLVIPSHRTRPEYALAEAEKVIVELDRQE